MKFIRIFSFALLGLFALVSCNDTQKKQTSQGTPYEIIIVATNDNWDNALSDTLQSILKESITMLNSPEPMYTISRIHPNSFQNMLRLHRNVLMVDTGAKYEEPRMTAQYDVNSAPQIIVSLTGPDVQSLTRYTDEHRKELQTIFEIAERNRSLALNRRTMDRAIVPEIAQKFGFNIVIPNTYVEAKANGRKDFMWLRKHYAESEQGIFIYSYPYSDRSNFLIDSLLARRNEFVGRIEGTNQGSHMTTSEVFTPILTYKRINGRDWAEMRGFWDMKGDYYGGPFISYSTLDRATNMVVTIDMYILSPNHGKLKRNYYRQLQHLIYSVSFPQDKPADKAAEGSVE